MDQRCLTGTECVHGVHGLGTPLTQSDLCAWGRERAPELTESGDRAIPPGLAAHVLIEFLDGALCRHRRILVSEASNEGPGSTESPDGAPPLSLMYSRDGALPWIDIAPVTGLLSLCWRLQM